MKWIEKEPGHWTLDETFDLAPGEAISIPTPPGMNGNITVNRRRADGTSEPNPLTILSTNTPIEHPAIAEVDAMLAELDDIRERYDQLIISAKRWERAGKHLTIAAGVALVWAIAISVLMIVMR